MADELFEAELFDEEPAEEKREKRQLNGAMGSTLAIVVLFILLAATIGMPQGLMGNDGSSSSHWLPPVEERTGKIYDDSDVFSRVSWNGSHAVGEVQSIFVEVPAITLKDGGAGATGDAEVHLGLWLPVIEGCDYTANISEECKIPVIAEIGPYYDDGDVDALTPADRLGRFLIENFVPHGFGVAQVSVLAPVNRIIVWTSWA